MRNIGERGFRAARIRRPRPPAERLAKPGDGCDGARPLFTEGGAPPAASGNRGGSEIRESELAIASEVSRGDTVEVDVQVSSAHITAEGIAEEGGRRGTVITVRNVKTGRKFRARIEGKDKVSVLPGSSAGLVGDDEEKS